MKALVMSVVSQHFRPEFINRIDETVVFHPLDKENIRAIASIQLERLAKRMETRGYELVFTEALLDFIGEVGLRPNLWGASIKTCNPTRDRKQLGTTSSIWSIITRQSSHNRLCRWQSSSQTIMCKIKSHLVKAKWFLCFGKRQNRVECSCLLHIKMRKENDRTFKIGLVSISDRASSGVYQDQGIPELQQWLEQALVEPFEVETRLIPDEQPLIEQTLKELVDEHHCHLVLTTGGTGPAKRDVTPDATLAVADREMPGFGEQMRQVSLYFVPTAILSRQVGVIRKTV